MEDLTLDDLLDQYRQGDPDALAEVVERTRTPLYRYIMGLVQDPHLADDVFQDVWIRAIKGLHRYKRDRLLAWLFRIARNRVFDLSRKRKPDLSLQQPVGDASSGGTVEDLVPGKAFGADRNVGNRELAQRIVSAVDRLPVEQREVYLMRTEADMPFKEIAECQSVSINTALARMQYALKHLREALADDYDLLNAKLNQTL